MSDCDEGDSPLMIESDTINGARMRLERDVANDHFVTGLQRKDVGVLLNEEARLREEVATLGTPRPVPMILNCPSCGERHIDEGDFATKPHHTHACQSCGMVWRPAVVHTVGVRFLPGFKS